MVITPYLNKNLSVPLVLYVSAPLISFSASTEDALPPPKVPDAPDVFATKIQPVVPFAPVELWTKIAVLPKLELSMIGTTFGYLVVDPIEKL